MSGRRITFEGTDNVDAINIKGSLACLEKVNNTRELLGVDSLKKVFQLDTGEQVYIISNANIDRVHIVVSEETKTPILKSPESEEEQVAGVADFVSGVVISGEESFVEVTSSTHVTQPVWAVGTATEADYSPFGVSIGGMVHEPIEQVPDEVEEVQAVKTLRQTDASSERFDLPQARAKLWIEPNIVHQPVEMADPPYSQHRYAKSGSFSGPMRALVQLILGIGIVGPRTYEARWITEGTEEESRGYVEALNEEGESVVSSFNLPVPEDKDPISVELKYDYRFHCTHGLTWGKENEKDHAKDICYLLEISTKGVFAMPLPLDEVSKTVEGKNRYLELFPELENDDLFELLGGFPTGESFPALPATLLAHARAGEVLELLSAEDMEVFYEGFILSSAMGWAIQPNGKRADNVCIKWGDTGCQVSYQYTITIEMTPYNKARELPRPEFAEWLPANTELYLKRKAARLSEEQAAQLSFVVKIEDRLELLEEMEVEGPMSGKAKIKLNKSGILYHPGRHRPRTGSAGFSEQPHIKFPEPLAGVLGELVSFDFTPAEGHTVPEVCDAPLAVIVEPKGGISTVNYYWEGKPAEGPKRSTTKEPCQFSGKWETIAGEAGEKLKGNFYTSYVDFRESIVEEPVWITKSDAGKLVYCRYLAIPGLHKHGTVNTHVFDSGELIEHTGHSAKTYRVSIIFPEGDRNVYYVTEYTDILDNFEYSALNPPKKVGQGNITRFGVIYNWAFHFLPFGQVSTAFKPEILGDCKFQEYAPAVTQESNCFPGAPDPGIPDYNIEPTSSFTANLLGCTGQKVIVAEYLDPPPKGPTWQESNTRHRKMSWKTRIFGDIPIHGAVFMEGELVGPLGDREPNFYDSDLDPWWFKPSPDNDGEYAMMKISQSHWGNRVVNFYKQPFPNPDFHYGSPESMWVYPFATFVGFIS